MAKAKAKAGSRTKKAARRSAARRKPAARRQAAAAAKPRKPHKFVKSHHREEDFKTDGLRTYAHYRDLGVKDATHGMAVAHVIRFQGQCDPEGGVEGSSARGRLPDDLRAEGHNHHGDQGQGVHTMHAGDCWLQPHEARCTRCSIILTAARSSRS